MDLDPSMLGHRDFKSKSDRALEVTEVNKSLCYPIPRQRRNMLESMSLLKSRLLFTDRVFYFYK